MKPEDDEFMAYQTVQLLYPGPQLKLRQDFVNRCRWKALQMIQRADVWHAVEVPATA
jgi:hypothetical protein